MLRKNPQSPKKIILIDDDLEFIKMVGDSLSLIGYQALLFQNPREAILAIQRERVSLVITDYHMEDDITALEVIKAVKEYDKSIPVIVVSGDPDQKTEISSLQHGAYAFFTKPLDFEKLMQVAGEIC